MRNHKFQSVIRRKIPIREFQWFLHLTFCGQRCLTSWTTMPHNDILSDPYQLIVCKGSTALRQTAVTAYFSSKQLLLFVFELQDSLLPSSTGILTAVQRQTAVPAYFLIYLSAVCQIADRLIIARHCVVIQIEVKSLQYVSFICK